VTPSAGALVAEPTGIPGHEARVDGEVQGDGGRGEDVVEAIEGRDERARTSEWS
jgi:hypothetical protein